MVSKLKKAKNLLNNPHVRKDEIDRILADLSITLVQDRNLSKDVKNDYAATIAQINSKLGYFTELIQKEKERQNMLRQELRQEFSENRFSSAPQIPLTQPKAQPSSLEFRISTEMITHYAKSAFTPDLLTKGSTLWIAPGNFTPFVPGKGNKIWIYGRGNFTYELINDAPSIWLGDLRILDKVTIPETNTSYARSTTLVEAIINYERVKALYTHYKKTEHRPTEYGELGWTMNTPFLANKSGDAMTHRPLFSRDRITTYNEATYIVKIGGFVIFVSGIDQKDIETNTVFDIFYIGTSMNGKSGKATLTTNPIREKIMAPGNIEQYLKMEKEGLYK